MLFELVQGLFPLAEGALGGLLLHLLQHLLHGLLEQVRRFSRTTFIRTSMYDHTGYTARIGADFRVTR